MELLSQGPYSSFVDWINQGGNPATERSIGGVVPAYPIFMFVGIVAVIILSVIKLKQRNIPLAELEWGILITVPIGVLGGTIFGKIFLPNMIWYHVFFFWEPGMSLFGSLALGTTAGFAWFYRRSKKTKISVWVYADCIIPNILIGQAIGRWGNFYNHEILGAIVDYDSLNWLIPAIKNRLWYFPQEIGQVGPIPSHWWELIIKNGQLVSVEEIRSAFSSVNPDMTLEQAQLLHDGLLKPIEYHQPLFLIEGILNVCLWFILNFFVANLSRFFQKKAHYPWDKTPKAFPGWYNHQYKSLAEKDLVVWPTQLPIKYKTVTVKDANGLSQQELKVPFFSAWNKAYYYYELDDKTRHELFKVVDDHYEMIELNENLLEKAKELHKNNLIKIKKNYQRKLQVNKHNKVKYNQILAEKKVVLTTEKNNYASKSKSYYNNLGGRLYKIKPNPLAKQITSAFNPMNYFILRCGVLTGGYVFGYTFYRTMLETTRMPQEYFIQNHPIANFIMLSLIILSGLLIIIYAQFFAPNRYRELGWLYEKSY